LVKNTIEQMRIAFIGNHEPSFSTETHHRKTFESMGHEVIQFQENKTSTSAIIRYLRANKVDMLYWTHTHSFRIGNPREVNEMLRTCRALGVPTVGYHLDLWLGLEREKDLRNDPYWGIEHFFTVDKLMADWLNTNTRTKGYFLPAGVFDQECVLGTPNREKYPHDIIFTGAKGYHHEWPYRPKLIEWLQATYGERFGHYGNGGMAQVRGLELNNLYASARIVIGDTLCKNFNYPWYSSDRLFEVCGRGGFLIYPRIEGLETMYDPKTEVAFYPFGNFEMLKAMIEFYLDDGVVRDRIRLNAFERTKREHTYKHRLQFILDTLCK
jgi:hypothetical protein